MLSLMNETDFKSWTFRRPLDRCQEAARSRPVNNKGATARNNWNRLFVRLCDHQRAQQEKQPTAFRGPPDKPYLLAARNAWIGFPEAFAHIARLLTEAASASPEA